MLNKKKFKLSLNSRVTKLTSRIVAFWLMLVFLAPSVHAFSYVTFSPPGSPPGSTLDVTYGVDGFVIEDFEDVYLIPGLAISWEEPMQHTVLAGIVSKRYPLSTWDGTHILVNEPGNAFPDPTYIEDTLAFHYAPGAQSIGIGLSQFETRRDENAEVWVNDTLLITNIKADPHFNTARDGGPYRNLYLRIDAAYDEVIYSVQFRTEGKDLFDLDHVAILPILDDKGPITLNMAVNPNPIAVGNLVTLTANVDDTALGGSIVALAEYSLDNCPWTQLVAQDGSFDEVSENVTATFTAPSAAGVYDLRVIGTDAVYNIGPPSSIMLVVYDPDGGFVTGGGWIDSPAGAYLADPSLSGKANFGFVSKYKKGANVLIGNTEFQFKAGDLNFHSSSYDWLVVTGSDYAKFKGWGSINGEGDYRFMLWAGDAPDTFRIKIWWEDGEIENVVYDNGFDQLISGGSIVVHTK